MSSEKNKKTTIKKIFLNPFFFLVFLGCFVASFSLKIPNAQAAITYYGSASTPSDNSSNNADPTAVTPPSSMQAGDLVIMIASNAELLSAPTLAISNAGGQSWTALTQRNNSILKVNVFWCRYNGSWSANPSVSFGSGYNNTVTMHVFRPTGTNYKWEIDVSESSGTFSAPSSSPYTVTITGVTTQTDGALVFAAWSCDSSITWGSLTSGWSTPGSSQYRNTWGIFYKQSLTAAYLVKSSAGATGNVSKNQSAAWLGSKYIIAFREKRYITTLGDGTDPSSSTIAPGASATEIDRFSLATDYETDSITGLTVTLGPTGAYNNIATVDVQTTGGTSKCSTSSITGNTVSLTSCGITATTTSTSYKIMITPKSHADMPAVPGASYATTATVTSVTGSNTQSGTDTDSATITVDNASPGNVISASITAFDTENDMWWTNPADSDFTAVVILRRASSAFDAADVPVEGKTDYVVNDTIGSAIVAGIVSSPGNYYFNSGCSNGTVYYYKFFTLDSRGNYNAGTEPTGSPVTPIAGSLTFDIVNSGGSSVSNPSVSFSNKNFSWSSQQSTGTLGISSQKLRVTNTRVTRNWTLAIAATTGNTANWVSGGNAYDFNDSAANGRLQVDASGGTITPKIGCSSTGLSKGVSTYFAHGSTDSITVLSADGTAAKFTCYWDFTGIGLTQDIPASQKGGTYSISMTLTAS